MENINTAQDLNKVKNLNTGDQRKGFHQVSEECRADSDAKTILQNDMTKAEARQLDINHPINKTGDQSAGNVNERGDNVAMAND